MPSEGTQPEYDPKTPVARPDAVGEVLPDQYTVPASFLSDGNGDSVDLDLSGINGMGGDDVVVYAATGATPTSRSSVPADRRGQWPNAPRPLPSALAGGSWTNADNYWVQVIDNTQSVWYQGHVTAAVGDADIELDKQPW
jgi:hypothetical protein